LEGFKFPDGTTQTTSASGDGHSLDASDGSSTDVVYVNEEGNVGIGTTEPEAKLDVRDGDIKVDGFNVGGFVGFAKQTATVTDSAGNWKNIPGTTINFTLPSNKTVNFRSFGSVYGNGGSGQAGFRFVIDDIPYGDDEYGDIVVSCPGGGYTSWYMERNVFLQTGNHSVTIQLRKCSGGTITSWNNEGMAARLFVEAW